MDDYYQGNDTDVKIEEFCRESGRKSGIKPGLPIFFPRFVQY